MIWLKKNFSSLSMLLNASRLRYRGQNSGACVHWMGAAHIGFLLRNHLGNSRPQDIP
ncbi:hypothetical protein CHCC14809_0117 [Bacillus licheniformis]|nr:hypothetical protein CHCC5026_3465 [Bacillus licheniformis]TWK04324.1 hypothetical protein CHCC20487_3481 [Bacillus licheniformis]TWK21432.1 hypothetical protein CHCC20373_4092 [Bacillus licheniformis]TWK50008.1 hypothetical protein CHCC20344_1753 [Bacillus licheniformis]TWK61071.1 hypothetical protein CHCC20343_2511 [Bacillus licheniformis]